MTDPLDFKRGDPAVPGPVVAHDARRGPAPGASKPASPRGADRVLACELAWEVHAQGYWSQVRNADGTRYRRKKPTSGCAGLASWRTAYKRLAVGRMLMMFEEPERSLLRSSIARGGASQGYRGGPSHRTPGRVADLAPMCQGDVTVLLQGKVSAALDALPRGREPSPPGERFRRAVLSAMPDIEATGTGRALLRARKRVVSSPNPIAIFLAGCRECLPEWELQAAKPTRAASNVSNTASCPTWANPA